jgi:hypothetical protein
MFRRTIVLCGLFIIASQLSSGCCCWRPFLWRGCCWPNCYGPGGASYPVSAQSGDPGCACYSPPHIPAAAVGAPGQPVYVGPAVPLGQPQVTPGGGVPNPMAPSGPPKN